MVALGLPRAPVRNVQGSSSYCNHAVLCLHAKQEISTLLQKGGSDAHREAAALREAQLGLKLEAGRVARSEMMMRQKVIGDGTGQLGLRRTHSRRATVGPALHRLPRRVSLPSKPLRAPPQVAFVERVNAELSELLERCDADALAAQGALEGDKAALSRHTAALQAEVGRRAARSNACCTRPAFAASRPSGGRWRQLVPANPPGCVAAGAQRRAALGARGSSRLWREAARRGRRRGRAGPGRCGRGRRGPAMRRAVGA
jgi:hypothetical protein